jgi:antitoxin component YwqK of YwqJK toxin-antitoxin module
MLTWWSGDKLRIRLNFQNGKKEGKQEWYHENGNRERVATYVQDANVGEMVAWYPDGAVQSIQSFKDGKPTGNHQEYYPRSSLKQRDEDRLARSLHYDDNGALHGAETTFYDNGKTQAICFYDHGKLNGIKKMWDHDGNLVEEGHYVLGKLDGRFFQKMQDKREIVYTYKDNLKNGLHQVFYPPNQNGQVHKALEATYENDVANGLVSEYNENGEKMAETPYKIGLKEGLASLFAPNGKLQTTIEFHNNARNGLTVEFFPNGSIHRETQYVADLREGEEKTYHDDESLASVCQYRKDLLEGLFQSWNPEGVLVFEAEYQNGQRHGLFKKYYDDGSPYIIQTFAYDQPNGEKKKFDKSGSFTVSNFAEGKLIKAAR